MPAGDGTLGRVADGIAGAAVASCRRNARHKAERLPGLAALAAGLGVSVPAFAPGRAAGGGVTPGRVPTDEWVRRAQLAAAGGAGPALTRVATGMLRKFPAPIIQRTPAPLAD